MLNSLPYLKRKLKNYRTLNKVGDVYLSRSMEALSEVQQRKKNLDEQLEKTDEALNQSSFYHTQGDKLVPELMANQNIYVNALINDRVQQLEKLGRLEKDVDEKLKEVFKLKKTNEAVQHKMQLAKHQMMETYLKKMDLEIADVLQNSPGGQD